MLEQLYEVLTKHGPIDVVRFDSANGHASDDNRILRLAAPVTAVAVRVEITAARASATVDPQLHLSTVPTDEPVSTGATA